MPFQFQRPRGQGLSPLARGNHSDQSKQMLSTGPIPARTGQPPAQSQRSFRPRAYPRSHGATIIESSAAAGSSGLSPLARGNPRRGAGQLRSVGPIPARTGQPCPQALAPERAWAYPRSHGATVVQGRHIKREAGLSPLARGNRRSKASNHWRMGPIPARTGQPLNPAQPLSQHTAYPRSHGATAPAWPWPQRWAGLSPLARGNRAQARSSPFRTGPIPARTGQPWVAAIAHHGLGAYPRSHGATCGSRAGCQTLWGLSPLARGNRSAAIRAR